MPTASQAVRKASSLRMTDGEVVPNKYSSTLTQKKSQGASQAMLYATGLEVSNSSSHLLGPHVQITRATNQQAHRCGSGGQGTCMGALVRPAAFCNSVMQDLYSFPLMHVRTLCLSSPYMIAAFGHEQGTGRHLVRLV
jgi:hypothetical protein